MVYCGRPSSACEACRVKKTKCDADPNGCKQCRFVGRVCPGYRSAFDAAFRDETANLVRKAIKSTQRKPVGQVRVQDRRRTPTNIVAKHAHSIPCAKSETAPHKLPFHPRSLSRCVNEEAKCYFVSKFTDGILFAMDEDFDPTNHAILALNFDSTLDASFEATSLLCFATYIRDLDLMHKSRRRYVEAITLTNRAIASPTEAVKDATLLSVNFLGLYEVLSGQTKRSMRSWADHCNGAAALLKLRGDSQFDTPAGCRLFRQIRASLIIGCLQWTMRIPHHIFEMSSLYARRVGLTGSKLRLFEVGAAFCQFRYDVRNRIVTDLLEILKGALQLDEPLAELCRSPPPEWHFKTRLHKKSDSAVIRNTTYHVYPQTWVAGSWNTVRSLRILIHMEIYHALRRNISIMSPNFSDVALSACKQQLLESTEICRGLQADIIASAPQLLGYIGSHPPPAPRSAFILVWPIWTAGCMSLATPETRAYCSEILDSIGRTIGHTHALRLGNLLKADAEPVVWTRS